MDNIDLTNISIILIYIIKSDINMLKNANQFSMETKNY